MLLSNMKGVRGQCHSIIMYNVFEYPYQVKVNVKSWGGQSASTEIDKTRTIFGILWEETGISHPKLAEHVHRTVYTQIYTYILCYI